ncbi:hypothetical protein VQH23_03970 [Pararoseomonas sp. SCSIO 73927]|uniref:hypothetical protein n=1 Tax=Pararoseomonas sp. SCSIO 73927 TaxID=3114537 RepID=UPI0030D14789
MVYDSLNFFELRQPVELAGMPVVAVYGFDEEAPADFKRGPGTSPGNVLGFVTTAPLYNLDTWRQRTNPRLSVDDYTNYGRSGPTPPRAKQVHCSYWGPG